MSLTLVIIGGIALLLLYAAIKNKHPVDVVKNALGASGPIRPLVS